MKDMLDWSMATFMAGELGAPIYHLAENRAGRRQMKKATKKLLQKDTPQLRARRMQLEDLWEEFFKAPPQRNN
jgi:hypothetical protein